MTKMATTPIYDKNPSKIFSGTSGPISMKLGMKHWGLQPKKLKTVDFSETIAASDLKVGSCRQLIEFMKVCEY